MSRTYLILIAIVFISICLRFYRLSDLASFSFDQEQTAIAARQLLIEHKPVLLGMKTGTGEIYIAPFYFYLFTIPVIFSKMDPIGLSLLASLIGVLTTIAFFLVGRELFSERIGLIASFLHAISLWIASFDRVAWNPNPLILTTLLLILSVAKIYQGRRSWYLLLSAALGFSFSLHLSSIFFVPILALLFLIKRPPAPTFSLFVKAAVIVLFFLSPLILFDLRHGFVNSRALAAFLTGQGGGVALGAWTFLHIPSRTEIALANLWFSSLPIAIPFSRLLASIFLILILFISFKKNPFFVYFTLLAFLITIGGLSFFKGDTPNYYFFVLVPFFLIGVAVFVEQGLSLLQKNIRALFYGLLLILPTFLFFTNLRHIAGLRSEFHTLKAKRAVVEFILSKAQGSAFTVSYTAMPGTTYGFSYLFDFYQKRPSNNPNDPVYTIIIPEDFEGIRPQYVIHGIGISTPKK